MTVMFINMALLLLTSNMITNEWRSNFGIFCLSIGTLSLTLFLQYLVEYLRKEITRNHKEVIQGFLVVTGIRTIAAYAASLFSLEIGSFIFLSGVLVSMFTPLFFQQRQTHAPINLPHLIERISLLVIITFGEMIMGIAEFFTPENFSLNAVLYFVIMALLFLYYFGEFDHAINEAADTQGLHLIYSHYPIFFGLLMLTVSFTFMTEAEAHPLFVVTFLYAGLAMFQWAVISNGKHNKEYLLFDHKYLAIQAGLLLIGFIGSLLSQNNMNVVLYITTAAIFAIEAHYAWFFVTRSKKNNAANWDLI